VKEIRQSAKANMIECTGFQSHDSEVKSFYDVKKQHSGCINHMNATGNTVVYNWIEKQI